MRSTYEVRTNGGRNPAGRFLGSRHPPGGVGFDATAQQDLVRGQARGGGLRFDHRACRRLGGLDRGDRAAHQSAHQSADHRAIARAAGAPRHRQGPSCFADEVSAHRHEEEDHDETAASRGARTKSDARVLRFSWPVPRALITQSFGLLPSGEFHHGSDIPCVSPTPVRASKAGVIIMAGWNPFYGDMVVIQHKGGWSTLYGHMGHLNVRAGRWVRARQELGTCGTSGRSSGPHVHFEIRRLGRFYNPWLFIGPRGL
jgi:murein DD-endopeptidase MepM/ murein hydrolase activator NlpD